MVCTKKISKAERICQLRISLWEKEKKIIINDLEKEVTNRISRKWIVEVTKWISGLFYQN